MRLRLLIIGLLSIVLFVVGCQAASDGEEDSKGKQEDVENTDGAFPVTIDSADKTVEIKEKPERILPLSLDVAEIVLELVEPDKVAAVPAALEDSQLSSQAENVTDIEERVSSAVNIDPEEILSYEADLLLLTKMHGQEEDASDVLSSVDLPILTFNTMDTVEDYLENIGLIGEAVGESGKAIELVEELETDIEDIQEKIPEDVESPSVLVLSEVGPGTGPFMMGPSNISYDLIKLADAKPAVDEIGLENSTPASIEQVMQMEPDYIFLLDFVGNGEESFTELNDNPGWSSLQAVKDDRVKVLDVKYLMNPNVEIIEGLDIMVDWIYE